MQGDWVIEAVKFCRKNDKKTIEPIHEINYSSRLLTYMLMLLQAEQKYTKHIEELSNLTLFPQTKNW
jgi:hypothetical protein